ncbi:MAG: LamG-like jellyroll fold domain-containing protein, partial [Spirochaetia bacterium]
MKRIKAADSFFSIGLISCFLAISPPVYSEEVLKLGKEDRWNTISTFESVTLEEGRGGFYDLVLEEQSYEGGESGTDLLLHFDTEPFHDDAGHYTVEEEHKVELTGSSRLGKGAAKFARKDGGLHLEPAEGAFFENTSGSESFSIEFWLYPYYLDDGEVLLSWEGQNTLGDELYLQQIRGYIENRRLNWDFSEIFFTSDFETSDFTVSGIERLVPREWHHHLITFDAETGLLEYYLDGEPEAVSYTTDTGREGGTIHLPYIGSGPEEHLSIGPDV